MPLQAADLGVYLLLGEAPAFVAQVACRIITHYLKTSAAINGDAVKRYEEGEFAGEVCFPLVAVFHAAPGRLLGVGSATETNDLIDDGWIEENILDAVGSGPDNSWVVWQGWDQHVIIRVHSNESVGLAMGYVGRNIMNGCATGLLEMNVPAVVSLREKITPELFIVRALDPDDDLASVEDRGVSNAVACSAHGHPW